MGMSIVVDLELSGQRNIDEDDDLILCDLFRRKFALEDVDGDVAVEFCYSGKRG